MSFLIGASLAVIALLLPARAQTPQTVISEREFHLIMAYKDDQANRMLVELAQAQSANEQLQAEVVKLKKQMSESSTKPCGPDH